MSLSSYTNPTFQDLVPSKWSSTSSVPKIACTQNLLPRQSCTTPPSRTMCTEIFPSPLKACTEISSGNLCSYQDLVPSKWSSTSSVPKIACTQNLLPRQSCTPPYRTLCTEILPSPPKACTKISSGNLCSYVTRRRRVRYDTKNLA